MRWPTLLLTGFGLGRCPVAPGTLASLLPVAVALALLHVLESPSWVNAALAALAVLASIACLAFGGREERRVGRKDPSHVVADEIAGQSLALILVPWDLGTAGGLSWTNLAIAAVAFGAFRTLDIAKPWPISRVQRAPGGWGILVDDLLAGAGALLVTQMIFRAVLPTL